MRTKLSYEVERDMYGNIESKGAVLCAVLKNENEIETLELFLDMLQAESGYDFHNGYYELLDDKRVYYCVGYIEVDREQYETLQDDYRTVKIDFRNRNKNRK